MPKKTQPQSDLAILRKGLGLSQSEWARRLGVSASMVKKLEEGTRSMSADVASRIFAETGILFLNQPVPREPFSYTKEDHLAWMREIQLDQKGAIIASRVVLRLVELMLVSASRPGVQKSYQVFNALIQAVEKVRDEFRMERHIEAELRDRHSTETKLYSVRELRDNDLLAEMVGFKDDPALTDDDTLPLAKATGWLPAKELFNIWWQHRELVAQLRESPETGRTEEANARLAELAQTLETAIGKEVDKFLPLDSASPKPQSPGRAPGPARH